MKSIDILNLTFSYGRSINIFESFNIKLEALEERGKITVIMGASGAGKSTLLKILLGVEKPKQGRVALFPQQPVISYVPQEPILFEHLSVEQNARYFHFAGAYKKRFDDQLYNELVNDLGLNSVLTESKSVTHLSGGQRQRISLLRALSIRPDFLFLDEPCNGLDAEVKRSFLNKLREISENYGLFVLYVTHHKLEAQLIADEIIYLVKDKIKNSIVMPARGTVQQFLVSPPVIEAANVFNFPDVKILPGFRNENGEIQVARNADEIDHYWLIRDENISFSDRSNGIAFNVVSKSNVFSVIQHKESDLEWMITNHDHANFQKGDDLFIEISGELLEYDKQGQLIGAR